ncbi:MAG: AraC family transcriptional regulator [Clostridiales bacterium]|nr:AraC family transcriptional regulator [Clostridiales bacterium]
MQFIKQLNDAVDYIENNYTSEIDFEKAAKLACCSTYHFRRMFSYIAGVTLSEYIRKRKMTLAALELQNTNSKVTDVSFKYGYDSPTAFNRAFKSIHGVSPKKAKDESVVLKTYSPISFNIQVTGATEMKYKIISKDAFRIIGYKKYFEFDVDENLKQVPKFWRKITLSDKIPKLVAKNNIVPIGLLGVSTCMYGTDFDYYIASASDMEIDSKMDEYIIPTATWAIFECVGALPDAMQEMQKRIITEWFPTSGYEYADAPDIELYYKGNQRTDDYKSEVWIPVKRK